MLDTHHIQWLWLKLKVSVDWPDPLMISGKTGTRGTSSGVLPFSLPLVSTPMSHCVLCSPNKGHELTWCFSKEQWMGPVSRSDSALQPIHFPSPWSPGPVTACLGELSLCFYWGGSIMHPWACAPHTGTYSFLFIPVLLGLDWSWPNRNWISCQERSKSGVNQQSDSALPAHTAILISHIPPSQQHPKVGSSHRIQEPNCVRHWSLEQKWAVQELKEPAWLSRGTARCLLCAKVPGCMCSTLSLSASCIKNFSWS